MRNKNIPVVLLGILLILSISGKGYTGLVFESEIPIRTIIVDGDPSDWTGITPWITDPQGDTECEEGTDFKTVYLAIDDYFLYWRMDIWIDIFYFGEPGLEKYPMIHFYRP